MPEHQKQDENHTMTSGHGRNYWGVQTPKITTLLQKKNGQVYLVGAVGYIITLYSSEDYVKSWGSVQILGVQTPPRPPVVAPMTLVAI